MNVSLLQTGIAASAGNAAAISARIEPPDSSPQARRLMKECQKFEGILIANLWNQMEKGMDLGGPGNDPGSGTMQGFGIQSAALGIANAGGLGIARMLYHQLAPRLRNGSTSGAAARVPGGGKGE